jgi:hypothetical protein
VSKNFGVNIAASTIRGFLRRELKWKVVCTRLGPMIRDMDKEKEWSSLNIASSVETTLMTLSGQTRVVLNCKDMFSSASQSK